jgi:hypothetical protein
VAPDEVGLELLQLVRGDPDVGELAEPGIDPVYGPTRIDRAIDQSAAPGQSAPRLGVNRYLGGRVARHPNDFFNRQRFSIEYTGWSGHRPKLLQCRRRFNPWEDSFCC